MRVGKHGPRQVQGHVIDPLVKLLFLFFEQVEELGRQMAAHKRGTNKMPPQHVPPPSIHSKTPLYAYVH